MKRAKGGRGENKLFSLKEAVLGKTGMGYRDFIYIYNFIGFVSLIVFLIKKKFFLAEI